MDWALLLAIVSPGLIILLAGFLWQKYPPKKINHIYGYRTRRSMRNQQTWDFANQIGPVMFIKTGGYLLLIGLLAYWLADAKTAMIVSTGSMVAGLIWGLITCEKKLAEHFDDDENPKE